MIHRTGIAGLVVCDLTLHGDQRGWFKENWQREKMVAAGLPDFRPVQHNLSFNSRRGVTRGLHAEPWDKFISVAHGNVFCAWCDVRENSPTFGKVVSRVIGPETAVFVPRGVANGFQTLSEETVYSYLVTDHWSPEAHYSAVNLADPALDIAWPIPLSDAVISEKDRHHPPLAQATPVPQQKILVVGSEGQLAQALREEFCSQNREAEVEFSSRRPGSSPHLDLTAPETLANLDWRRYRAIINAAAFTSVDQAESAEGRRDAWQINAAGPGLLAQVAQRYHIPFVQVSTDYVFDGTRLEWEEQDFPSPLNVYGCSKAAGELAALGCPRHYIIRTSWVIGAGRNFIRTMVSLADAGASPSVVGDQHGRPTFSQDLARGIIHLLDNQAPSGIYHLSNSGPQLSFAELAQHVFQLRGRRPEEITVVSTEEYSAAQGVSLAPRPAHSTLKLDKIQETGFYPRDWRDVLPTYVAEVS
ncbi:dTDP-4-dehydrorhamnose reductase [Corynebacterium poyangense]|uniref:dTDP-4-dehydrorhamnose reductase n=2 Tax=Corynebacterium poyangense TaxID=2684405 RepID=A0A7H0SLR4_9CORY|nr:dTDP-4-dehydrorhamnose reductase [Corynebacterium poyangense]MBZ8177595.1 dTDP-4-dehydrorhamnose reductase [Corynebacterium poyangense]QNQ89489.1 dTDP-4-dehydrorhamnose reductase [Corynebacterium poyangense]